MGTTTQQTNILNQDFNRMNLQGSRLQMHEGHSFDECARLHPSTQMHEGHYMHECYRLNCQPLSQGTTTFVGQSAGMTSGLTNLTNQSSYTTTSSGMSSGMTSGYMPGSATMAGTGGQFID